jgi:chitin disaccharide deacetylase
MLPGLRCLIVNADDLGMSAGVNRGIFEAHRQGVVTSASLLVRWPAAAEAAAQSKEHPRLGLGLHVDLGEWAYGEGGWYPLYETVPLDDKAEVKKEVDRQLTRFGELTGENPTHLDSHQHVHRAEPLRSILAAIADELGIPLRMHAPRINYCGDFYGQTGKGEPYPEVIRVQSLIRVLTSLPPGITELGCHPGYDDGLRTMYRSEREVEIQTLCDPAVRTAIDQLQIDLCCFRACRGVAL